METSAQAVRPLSSKRKSLSVAFICISLLPLSWNSFGQEPKKATNNFIAVTKDILGHSSFKDSIGKAVELRDIGSSTLVEFKVRCLQGKTYTQWHVKSEAEDGLFIIERTVNGKDYEQIGFETGVGVPIETTLLYSWIDKAPIAEARYRLLKVYKDGRYYYSDTVSTSNGQLIKPVSVQEPLLIAGGE